MGLLYKKELQALYGLSTNSRSPLNKMAKMLKISQQGLAYQIKRLQEKQVLNGFYTIFDYACFGYNSFEVFLSINLQNPEKEQQLKEHLKKHPSVLSIVEVNGKWDILVVFLAKNASRFNKELNDLVTLYPSLIKRYAVLTRVVSYELGKRYLGEGGAHTGILVIGGDREKIILDKNDVKIMESLYNDTRIPYVRLALHQKCTPKTVIAKIKSLETRGIIKGYSAIIDSSQIGFVSHKIFLRYTTFPAKKELEFLKFCKQEKSITKFTKVLGEWDMEIDTETESDQHFKQVCKDIRKTFGENIYDIETCTVHKRLENKFLPQSFFSEEKEIKTQKQFFQQ